MDDRINQIISNKIISILRNVPDRYLIEVVEILTENNIRSIEVTMNSKGALKQIKELSNHFNNDILIGAGTVSSKQDVVQAAKAGAKYLITPSVSEEVALAAKAYSLPVIMGAMTPTEIIRAIELEAALVKIFPITNLGPGYIKDIMAPLNNLKIVAVGGITPDNALEYIKNGALAVGVGSSLVNNKDFSRDDWKDILIKRAQKFGEIIT